MINGRTKSILLQVAAKMAPQFSDTIEEFETWTTDIYNTLIGLHDKLGIDPSDGDFPKGGGGRKTGAAARSEKVASVLDDAPEAILADGNTYLDYRGIKALGTEVTQLSPNFPDFKTVDKKKSFWLTKDGEPTEFARTVGLA